MKVLLVLLFVAVAAAQQPGNFAELQRKFYIQFLRASYPDQLKYMQALDADLYGTMLQSALKHSELQVTVDGASVGAYDWVNKVLPNRDHSGFTKQTSNERHLVINRGGPVEVRMITEGGSTKVELLGDPLTTEGAKFDVLVPRNVYAAMSNLGDDAAVVTAVSAPAWVQSSFSKLTEDEMDAKFPSLAEFIAKGYKD